MRAPPRCRASRRVPRMSTSRARADRAPRARRKTRRRAPAGRRSRRRSHRVEHEAGQANAHPEGAPALGRGRRTESIAAAGADRRMARSATLFEVGKEAVPGSPSLLAQNVCRRYQGGEGRTPPAALLPLPFRANALWSEPAVRCSGGDQARQRHAMKDARRKEESDRRQTSARRAIGRGTLRREVPGLHRVGAIAPGPRARTTRL